MVVAELDAFESDLVLDWRQTNGGRGFLHAVFGVQDFEDAVGCGNALLDREVELAQILDGPVNRPRHQDHRPEGVKGHVRHKGIVERKSSADDAGKLDDRADDLARTDHPHLVVELPVACVGEARDFKIFHRKCLHDSDAGKAFMHDGDRLGGVFLGELARLADFLPIDRDGDGAQRQGDK